MSSSPAMEIKKNGGGGRSLNEQDVACLAKQVKWSE